MTKTEDSNEKVWDLAERIEFCMLSTGTEREIHARPMAAYAERLENAFYFLTDATSHKEDEIKRNPNFCLAFADSRSQKYVSISGAAEIENDREKIRELWATPAKAWWESADDPSIRILKVTPSYAQYWDSPGTIASYVKMAAAALTGARPDMGDTGKVEM